MKLLYFCNLFIISCNAFCIQPTNSLLLYSSKQICLHIKNNNFVLYKKPLSLLSPSLFNMNLKKNNDNANNNEIKIYEYLYPLLAFNIVYNLILLAFNIIHNLILL
jgi:hypothetical protein